MEKKETKTASQTRRYGEIMAQNILKGQIAPGKAGLFKKNSQGALVICLEGDLGSGKTTFAQGLLKGLGVKGPFTSPTFLIMKQYAPRLSPLLKKERRVGGVFHIDAYRIGAKDILNLGWEEIVKNDNIIIIEWPERIRRIIPENSLRIRFNWLDKDKREIVF